MASQITAGATIKRLSDTRMEIADRAQDIRGREVLDSTGEKIGKVDDLLIDDRENRVRFLEIASGGFLGMGESKVLIPVDAVKSVDNKNVRVDRTRQHLSGAPRYDPSVIDEDYVTRTYDYYGVSPWWAPGYNYPSRWYI